MFIIVANGPVTPGPAVESVLHHAAATVIAADGGTEQALSLGLSPTMIVGDMDSVNPEVLSRLEDKGVEILRVPPEKDETDLELALLTALERDALEIRIIGALGDRIDQTFANVYLLLLERLDHIDVKIVDGKQTLWVLKPGHHTIPGGVGDTVSLIPLSTDVQEITTTGLAYPLYQESLTLGPARGISNIILKNQVSIHFRSGQLLVVHTVGRA